MNSRSNTVSLGVLVVASAGLIWVLSDRTRQDHDANAGPGTGVKELPATEASEPDPAPSIASVPFEGKAMTAAAYEVQIDVGPPGAGGWPMAALEFAEEADSDPILSRYLEIEVGRIVDTTLDRGRYESHSITCRGHACQLLARDRTPDPIPSTGSPSYSFITPILHGLNGAGIRSPTSGADLQARVELIRGTRAAPAGIELLVVFANP